MRRSFLHGWPDLACALVPPLYKWQFRRALDAMQRRRVEDAAARSVEETRGCTVSQQVPRTMLTETAAACGVLAGDGQRATIRPMPEPT